jgi:hypothetical protein
VADLEPPPSKTKQKNRAVKHNKDRAKNEQKKRKQKLTETKTNRGKRTEKNTDRTKRTEKQKTNSETIQKQRTKHEAPTLVRQTSAVSTAANGEEGECNTKT